MKSTTAKKARRTGAPKGPRKAEEKKNALLDAAGSLFEQKGFDATTMDEIAAEADVAKGTLYHYFANKSDLLAALRENFENKIMDRITPNVEKCHPDDWAGKLKAWTYSAVQAYFELSGLHDVVIYGTGMPFRNAMADARITRYLTELIEDGANAGAWTVEDARWTATVMFYSFRGGCDEIIIGTHPAEGVRKKLYSLFLRILGVKAE